MKPILQALVVADHVYEDVATHKKIVVGVFHKVFLRKTAAIVADLQQPKPTPVPMAGFQAGSPFAYVSLTEIRDQQPLVARFVRLRDDCVLFQIEFKVKTSSPLDTFDAILPLPPLPLGEPGAYALELLWMNEPLGSCRIIAEEAKP